MWESLTLIYLAAKIGGCRFCGTEEKLFWICESDISLDNWKNLKYILMLTLSLPIIRCAGHNTDMPSNSNISKTVIQFDAFCTCSSVVTDV